MEVDSLSKRISQGLSLALLVSTIISWTPFVCVYHSIKAFRPHPTWTFRQSVTNHLLWLFLRLTSAVRFQIPQSLDPKSEKARWEVIEPASNEYYRLPLTADAGIVPLPVGGTWYPEKCLRAPPNDLDAKIILHMHGGGFVTGEGRDNTCAVSAKTLAHLTSHPILCLDYRLSSSPSRRFPAALQDAVTAFRHLEGLGYASYQIIISGDSAGGNLALGLLRYVQDNMDLFCLGSPLPSCPIAAVLLWSPWLDVTSDPNEVAFSPYARIDYLPSALVAWGQHAYLPSARIASRFESYYATARYPFATETPLWISTGRLESLRDGIVRYAHDMQAIEGNRIQFCECLDFGHDPFLTAHLFGRYDKFQEMAAAAAQFLADQVIPIRNKKEAGG